MRFLIQQLSDFLFLGLALFKVEKLRELLFIWVYLLTFILLDIDFKITLNL